MTLMIRFHNTLSGTLEPFVPIRPGEVKLYTCGPTVYDFPHIGNWRAYVFEDLLRRFLIFSGFKVTHVMNITDVDDKTIRDSKARTVKELQGYTEKFIDAFAADRDLLNILRADHYPRATEHVPEMVTIIKALLEKGIAYGKDGSIYFSIAKFPDYGRLSKISLEGLRPGQRGDSDEYEKESVNDFALWKAKKEGEPFWETELGPGRPGWHIECSAMSSRYLGPTFDIHCGGVDNIFPHHENEIAQSEAANGVKFVNYWLHCHHLVVNGEKMSKSKGNFYILKDILDRGYDPREVRFLLLSTHYRKMLDFTDDSLKQARAARNRIRDFLVDLRGVKRDGRASPEVTELIETARAAFIAGLADDLNIAQSLAALFNLISKVNVRIVNGQITAKDATELTEFFKGVDSVLGIEPTSVTLRPDPGHQTQASDTATLTMGPPPVDLEAPKGDRETRADVGEIPDPEIQKKIDEREKARAEKNFKLADKIRKELLDRGILLEDTKDGPRWKRVHPPRP